MSPHTDSAPPAGQAAASRKAARRTKRTARRHRLAWLACGGILAASGAVLISLAPTAETPAPALAPAAQPVPTFDASSPGTYAGTPTPPVIPPSTLAVPALGLQVPVVDTTTDARGYLGIPESNRAAHYTASASLGSPVGSVFLAGHANCPNGDAAPMGSIAQLAKGTPVYITDANGALHRYRAATLAALPKTGLPPSLISPAGPSQLVLVTCDLNSPWIPLKGTDQFANNLVATATPWP